MPHISFALRDLGVIFDKYIWSIIPILVDSNPVVTAESCCGTQNEQENTHNNVIEGDIRREITIDTNQKYQEKV